MIDIDALHRELLGIMLVFDKFCKEHRIDYSLYAGTLIGAVRHKGFIPWDDDVDICMSRRNYERFCIYWREAHPSGYFLQNNDTDPEWTQPFAKIRKEKSTYIEYEYQKELKHTGIFIDIFPLDRMQQGRLSQRIDYLGWVLYLACVKKLWVRYLPKKTNDGVYGIAESISRYYTGWFRSLLIKRESKSSLPIANVEGKQRIKKFLFSPVILNGYSEIEFEGFLFSAISHWDTYLKEGYGDYMTLPPIEERVLTHLPLVVSTDQDYREYENNSK